MRLEYLAACFLCGFAAEIAWYKIVYVKNAERDKVHRIILKHFEPGDDFHLIKQCMHDETKVLEFLMSRHKLELIETYLQRNHISSLVTLENIEKITAFLLGLKQSPPLKSIVDKLQIPDPLDWQNLPSQRKRNFFDVVRYVAIFLIAEKRDSRFLELHYRKCQKVIQERAGEDDNIRRLVLPIFSVQAYYFPNPAPEKITGKRNSERI